MNNNENNWKNEKQMKNIKIIKNSKNMQQLAFPWSITANDTTITASDTTTICHCCLCHHFYCCQWRYYCRWNFFPYTNWVSKMAHCKSAMQFCGAKHAKVKPVRCQAGETNAKHAKFKRQRNTTGVFKKAACGWRKHQLCVGGVPHPFLG